MASQHHHEEEHAHGSLKQYVIGFVLSIILTIIPLVVVLNDMFNQMTTYVILLVTAVAQLLVQLIFFMHIRDEKGPKYNLVALVFAIVLLLTIVIGSIFVMINNVVIQ